MTISALVKTALSVSGVTAIVGSRTYPMLLPQNPTYPAITYGRISNTGTNGSTALKETRYQIDCWAATYAGTQTLAAAVKAALEEHTDTDQTPGIKMSRVVNEIDDYDSDAEVYRTIVDVILVTTGD